MILLLAPVHPALLEAAVCGDHKVLMEVDNNILLVVVHPHGIICQQLRPRPIHLLNIIIVLLNDISFKYLLFNYFALSLQIVILS